MTEEEETLEEVPETQEPETVTLDKQEWEDHQKQLEEGKKKYIHLLAETENVRKRLHKEKEEAMKYAMENVLVTFLPPIDHFEQALKFAEQTSDEVKQWAVGFEMILTQFKNLLAEQGVTAIASVGNPFDPHYHEAVEMCETDDHPPGTILEEFTRGYRMGKRTIRPARVKVAKGLSEENNLKESEEEEQPYE